MLQVSEKCPYILQEFREWASETRGSRRNEQLYVSGKR